MSRNVLITMTKHIFVTGGVTSSLGKGIFAASLAKLLQARGYTVTIQKFDPYINVDPGTLNPYEHGECYVTEDGAETDLDLGHYERFLNTPTSQANNVTTGLIYQTVITNEREGEYLGKTVQVVPHITDEIQRRMLLLSDEGQYDVIITELGGTVGDIESLPYIEAVRQLKWELGKDNCMVVHLTLLPYLNAAKELKTKPTQHSVKELLSNGVQPDMLVCRTEQLLTEDVRKKLALFCNVDMDSVIQAIDADSIYQVPLNMQQENLDSTVLRKLALPLDGEPNLASWQTFLKKLRNPAKEITIGLIGKYVELQDAYKSIDEAFTHAAVSNDCKVNVETIHSETLTPGNVDKVLGHLDGVLVAPGFGPRGTAGKIEAIRYIRENHVPFFGICFGMQCAVIEYGRNVLGYQDASSAEIDADTNNPVISLMEEQKDLEKMGGTMRLGAYRCVLKKSTLVHDAYQEEEILERHRHRYEFNNAYLDDFEANGMIASGINPDNDLVEILELNNHPWFVGVQYHPELKSTVDNPHPLFVNFIAASITHQESGRSTTASKGNVVSYS